MRSVVLPDEESGGEREGPSPRVQLHELIETLTEESLPPVLAVLALWLQGPRALLPVWGLAFVVCVS